jgi:xanthine dehydrogenase FAD-binding subunit
MQVLFPQTLKELQTLLAEIPQGRIMAGGTDLLVKLRQSGQQIPAVFCLEQLPALQQTGWQQDEFCIGAAVAQQQLLDNAVMQTEYSGLHQALRELASPPIRHAATLVGNICSASPAADSLPPLVAMGATVDILGLSGCRILPVADFIKGPGQTCLQPGEFVRGVRLPRLPQGTVSVYYKVGKRKALAIAVASLAAVYRTTAEGMLQTIRLAWGSVGPTVVTAQPVEEFLRGKPLTEAALRQAGTLARRVVSPIDDVRASADYRRSLAGNLLLKLLATPTGMGEE